MHIKIGQIGEGLLNISVDCGGAPIYEKVADADDLRKGNLVEDLQAIEGLDVTLEPMDCFSLVLRCEEGVGIQLRSGFHRNVMLEVTEGSPMVGVMILPDQPLRLPPFFGIE